MRSLFVGLLLSVFVLEAQAQTLCYLRKGLFATLEQQYNEKLIAQGIKSNGFLLEVTRSPARSWTVIVTTPMGLSCVIAAGEEWQTLEPLHGHSSE